MNYIEFFRKYELEVSTTDGMSLQIRGLSSLHGNEKESVLQYAKQHKTGILIEITWKQTEQLADWIDYSDTPIEEKRARLPEFQALTIRIDELIKEHLRIDQEKEQQMDFNTASKQGERRRNCLHGQSCSFLRGDTCLKVSGQSVFTLEACPLPKSKWFRMKH